MATAGNIAHGCTVNFTLNVQTRRDCDLELVPVDDPEDYAPGQTATVFFAYDPGLGSEGALAKGFNIYMWGRSDAIAGGGTRTPGTKETPAPGSPAVSNITPSVPKPEKPVGAVAAEGTDPETGQLRSVGGDPRWIGSFDVTFPDEGNSGDDAVHESTTTFTGTIELITDPNPS